MNDRSATIAAADVLDNGDWSQLVSAKVGADGSRPKTEPAALHGAIVGNIVGFIGDVLLVTFSGQVGSDPVPCRTTVDVGRHRVGDQALLIFEQGDARRPILVGCLKESTSASAPAVELKADDETVTVTAKERIVLRCGKASLTLTKAGKVILQGEYISQRSMGVVRIKGGCVEIN